MLLYDCHCHSEHSHDSNMPIREIAEKCIELGFSGVSVTNHYDPLTPGLCDDLIDSERSGTLAAFDEISALREEYAGRIELLCGAEIGSPYRNKNNSDTITRDSRVDVIIGSVHVLLPIFNDGTVRNYNPYKERNPAEWDRIIESYFTDIYRNIAFCDIDIVGHVSYIQRYIDKDGAAPFNVKNYIDACVDIMKAAIAHNKAIEINAKSIDLCRKTPFSEFDFFKMYRDLGGELVTIGTDSHESNQFEGAFKAKELLKAVGYKNACYYKGRQPVFYSLD